MLGRYRDSVRAWSDPVGRGLVRLHLRPNHLTMCGLLVSACAGAAFVFGHVPVAGLLLILAGLFDLFDGSLARASGQATAFGAFLDSVIDRYSDIVVMLGIVVLYARMPHARGALLAMAGLAGSVMVSYTKARAESIGIECNVGMMERPERLICLITGALLGLMEPALWVLAILANVTALQRILFTRRLLLERSASGRPTALRIGVGATLLLAAAAPAAASTPSADTEQAWGRAVTAYQAGDPEPLAKEFGAEAALTSPIRDYARYIWADALARRGDLAGARAAALAVADRDPDSRLAPRALLRAATLASSAGDEAGAHGALKRLLERYPDAPEVPEALYLVGQTAEARQQPDVAAVAYRQLRVLAPTTAYAEAAGDRLAVLMQAGTPLPPISMSERIDRAERLLKGGVPKTAADEAEAIATESRDAGIVLRALRVVADGAARLNRYDAAARALELAWGRAPAEQRARLRLDQARMLIRAGQDKRALPILAHVSTTGTESEVVDALALMARASDEAGRDTDAAALYRQIATRFPNREAAGAAMWRLGWLAWLRGDVATAGAQWSKLAEAPGGRAFRVPALYWRARAVEHTRDRATAEPIYAKVVTEAPRSYYGMLASRRTGRSANGTRKTPAATLPARPEEAVATDPGFARVDLLRRIGLVEYAWEELEDVVQASVGDQVRLYGASAAYVRDERYHMALRIVRRHFGTLAVSGDPTLPRAFWEIIYPLGWRNEVAEAARRSGLDPYLVAAVVREESSYYPRAVSRAGARGLMQLMPATARPMADLRGLAFEGGLLLDDPRANLEIGASFLAGLLKEFGDPRVALAAYNAGPRRAREWWKTRRTNDMEAWVEQIPYDETRHYVKRVTLSWEEYRRIYAEE